jgi:hypothetical protein
MHGQIIDIIDYAKTKPVLSLISKLIPLKVLEEMYDPLTSRKTIEFLLIYVYPGIPSILMWFI